MVHTSTGGFANIVCYYFRLEAITIICRRPSLPGWRSSLLETRTRKRKKVLNIESSIVYNSIVRLEAIALRMEVIAN